MFRPQTAILRCLKQVDDAPYEVEYDYTKDFNRKKINEF
jgi:hypothetical protein